MTGVQTCALPICKGVCTMEDLAEQSIDELLEIENMTEEKAAELIMTARKPWFEGEA